MDLKKNKKKDAEESTGINKWLSMLIILVAALAVVGLTELFCNFKLLTLSGEDRGVTVIEPSSVEYTGYELTDAGLYRNAASEDVSQITISFGEGKYIDKFSYTYDYGALLDVDVHITTVNTYGVEETETIVDKNSPVLTESVIKIGKKVKSIVLYTDDSELLEAGIDYVDLGSYDLTITGFQVTNQAKCNPTRMGIAFLASVVLLSLLWYRKRLAKHPELIFAVIALTAGIMMIMIMPVSKIGWDEEMHFERAYELSVYPGNQQTTEELTWHFKCGIDTWPLSLPDSIEERNQINEYFDQTCLYETGDTIVTGATCSVYTSGYVASAFFIKLARLFHMSFTHMYQMGRLGNLLMFVFVWTLAIWFIPVGKRLLMMIGLMPTSIFLASCYSYDPTVTAFTTLGLALLIREAMKKEEGSFSMVSFIIAMLCFIWGMFPKAVYAPMVLAGFAIPSKNFKNDRQKWIARIGVAVVLMILLSSFVLPTLLNPSSRGDTRGGAVDVGAQMKNMFGHPISFISLLFKNIWDNFSPYILQASTLTQMGHWQDEGYRYVAAGIAIVAYLLEGNWKKDRSMKLFQRFWTFLGALGCVVLIWTAFYLTFTEVGKTEIGGVQPRYFLPVLFPFIYCLKTDRIQVQMTEENKNLLMTALSGIYILVVIIGLMLIPRCI